MITKIFEMVITSLSIDDKADRPQFFWKSFLWANISMDIMFGIFFVSLSNVEIIFLEQKLNWRLYTTIEAIPIIKWVELVEKKEFAAIALYLKDKIFILQIISLTSTNNHLSCRVQIALLIQDKAPTAVLFKYTNFTNIFSLGVAIKLPEYIRVNNHPINLLKDHLPPYGSIYSLEPIELETLKTYIKIRLANNFIKSFKSITIALMLIMHKSNKNLQLCVNYQGFHNLKINNWYLLSLIRELLDWLG